MRDWTRLALILISGLCVRNLAARQRPTEWIDPFTGHRIIQLFRQPGSSSSYFTQNEFTPDGRTLVITTPGGLAAVDLKTRSIRSIVSGRVFMIAVGRKTPAVYYMKQRTVYATGVYTGATREIARLPFAAHVASVNADETLLTGSMVEGPAGERAGEFRRRPPRQPGQRVAGIESSLHRRWAMHLPMALYTIDIKTGRVKKIYHSHDWLNHVQFSPTNPGLIMFCHEGPWELNDRIWTIRSDGSHLKKIHTRTMMMEIFGHEFWGADGGHIWYDLQTPRGEDFWLAGYELATGKRTWYHLERNEWSVHFYVSPDGKLFAGDGGDCQMVAHAKDGKWIYLFRLQLIHNRGLQQPGFIQPGVLRSERLVKMQKHNYRLEPNVQFTPDGKWVVFRSNMSGATQVYEVEVATSP
jgi:oligogalacturonide lyase